MRALIVLAAFAVSSVGLVRAESPADTEATFADGSVVRVAILQEQIEIQTKYGKLTVPMADVRSIAFAPRFPADVMRKVEAGIKRLGSDSFDQREAAVTELVELGAAAYAPLCGLVGSPDAELSSRAKAALERIREKVPAAKLVAGRDDRVEAAAFSIAGQVVSATVKVRSEYFGDVELKVGQLRGLRSLGGAAETALTVDAAKFGGKDDPAWMDAGVEVVGKLTITASGEVDMWNDGTRNYLTGPAGNGNLGQFDGRPTGLLLGRVGENGAVFVVGEKFDGVPAAQGKLYLRINPYNYSRIPVGSYKVTVAAAR